MIFKINMSPTKNEERIVLKNMKYINDTPTKTEKIMFENYGLYLIHKDENIYRYAPVHLKEGYTYSPSIEVEDNMVEYEHAILFDISSETVALNGYYDIQGIALIHKRMEELNFK